MYRGRTGVSLSLDCRNVTSGAEKNVVHTFVGPHKNGRVKTISERAQHSTLDMLSVERLPSINRKPLVDSDVALTAQCDFGTYGLGISTCRAYTLSMLMVVLLFLLCLAL